MSDVTKESTTMNLIEIRSITKSFGAAEPAIKDITLNVKPGEILTLLGPSGCGKTTTLRALAGLETITDGEIVLEGKTIAAPRSRINVPPENRDLGMVFQSYALWPHMTIRQNLALGLKVKKLEKTMIEKRVAESLDMVGLGEYADRSPSQLSGGQQQRVALARAIALRPKCLLFDEPLSNLDLLLREQMRVELRSLIKELGITAVYVTHDQPEALVISDQLAVMSKGRVQQVGRPEDVYRKPANLFTAGFLGGVNVLQPAVGASAGNAVSSHGGIRLNSTNGNGAVSGRDVIAIRPEALLPVAAGQEAANVITGVVEDVAFLGSQTEVRFHVGEEKLMARVHGYFASEVGDNQTFRVEPDAVMILEAEGSRPA